MKLLYISDHMYTTGGSHQNSVMHYQCLLRALTSENLVGVALTAGRYIDQKDGFIHICGYQSKFGQACNLLKMYSYCTNGRVAKKICRIIDEKQITHVFLNSSEGRLARAIKKHNKEIIIMTFYHDVNANLMKQFIKEKGIKEIPRAYTTVWNERMMQEYADYHITLNQRDAKLLEKYYGHGSDFFLPIALEDNYSKATVAPQTNEAYEILFAGVYYFPNVQGILWFCNQVLPRIKENVHLNIVGYNMEKLRGQINDSRVSIIGTVSNIQEWYHRCNLVIAPVFIGGGMKIKTAEAFMFGKQVVGTSESFEGYAEDIPKDLLEKHIFIKNGAEEFADAVQAAYRNAQVGQTVIPEVRETFVKLYSEEAGLKRIERLLEQVQ
ncbi:MAG: glycosyltransferase [Clostridia bacterium]|nr:glycosyltransferase [Clostridia bacterium]